MLIQADHQRGHPAASGHIVERDHLEPGAVGGRERCHQARELAGFAHDRDSFAGRRLERQGRLRGRPRLVQRQTTLLPGGRRKDGRGRHRAAVAPGGRHPSREAAKSEVGQHGSRRVRAVILGRATTEVELDVDVADDGRHSLAQQRLIAEFFEQFLDFWRRDVLTIGDQVLNRAKFLN